jgi:hypothetical protein
VAATRAIQSISSRTRLRLDEPGLYGDTVAQRLQHNATAFGGCNQHPHLVLVDVVKRLQPHATMHLLESHGSSTLDQQTTSHVALRINLNLQRLQANAKVVGKHAQGRVQARGKCGTQQVSGIRTVVITTDCAVYAKVQRGAATVCRYDGTVKRIRAACVEGLSAVPDASFGRRRTITIS